ncbi:MAG: hypothetical protein PUJ16_06140 [Campylobacteraceae bacterium]|nr:hypothetical protein [Campylobacteraceae bacterium]
MGVGGYLLGNSRIPYGDPRVKPEDDKESQVGDDIGLGNSRIFVIAREQSDRS